MTRSARLGLLAAGLAGLGVLLLWGLAGLDDFGIYPGPYGDVLNRVAVKERHATEVVTAVVFDYRGVDTLGEEFILFVSALGVALLLRASREEEEEEPTEIAEARIVPPATEPVRLAARFLIGPTVVLGLYVVAHAHLTPGGGFQGGAALATASALVFVGGRFVTFRRVNPVALIDLAEGAGAGGYAALGLLGVAAGAEFLANVLPVGTTGDLYSAGTIPVLNLLVGLAVSAAFVLIISEFLEQTLAIHRRTPR
jgi:multicomponent Na+:H+ antiporter subunit B